RRVRPGNGDVLRHDRRTERRRHRAPHDVPPAVQHDLVRRGHGHDRSHRRSLMLARFLALLALALLPAAAAVQAGDVAAARSVVARGSAGPPGSHPRTSLAVAYEPENPPTARTGGFGEPTCQECHVDSDVNAGPGTIEVAPPDFVVPDTTYPATDHSTDLGTRRARLMVN